MKYADGQVIRVGDRLQLWDGNEGVVVCSFDTGEFSPSFPEGEWKHLRRGVLIDSIGAGLIHYESAEPDLRLIARGRNFEK